MLPMQILTISVYPVLLINIAVCHPDPKPSVGFLV